MAPSPAQADFPWIWGNASSAPIAALPLKGSSALAGIIGWQPAAVQSLSSGLMAPRPLARPLEQQRLALFSRSLKLREVSAGGCNACEADTNVLATVGWDLGRFGIQFVASPRHADGLWVTGPVTENMREALLMTYAAMPSPKIVVACGACAINGGPFQGSAEAHNGVEGFLPVDLYIPGCPPHPVTILDGLLRILDKIR